MFIRLGDLMEKFNYDSILLLRNKYKKLVSNISIVRMIVFLVLVISFCLVDRNTFFYVIGFFFLFVFVVLIFIHDKYYKFLDYYEKYMIVLDEYKSRLDGSWKNFCDKGDEYSCELFDDLNIVGENSLFQYLSVCVTDGGRDRLINKLSNNKIGANKLSVNQKAVFELVNNVEFDVKFLVYMFKYRNKKVNLEDDFKYLDKSVGNRFVDLIIGVSFSIFCLISLFLAVSGGISYNYFFGFVIFNFCSNYIYSIIYREEFETIFKVSSDYSKLMDVYKLISNTSFKSSKLEVIKNNVVVSGSAIDKLVFIDDLNNLKNNILSSFIFNGLFSVNIIVMFLFSKFQGNNVSSLKCGVCDIEELEALISLAGIGVLNDNVCLPKFNSNVELKFTNIKHPLIDRKRSVGNDFECGNGVNIITGSNMGGKTSFLRTIGINLILMYAGTYVCADSFSSDYFKIFTSISVSDDIDKGISTFYGELLRIKKVVDYKEGNRIVLVDEMFKGTNYNDRMYGALNVIRKLNNDKTILFITTHDFDVCDFKVNNLVNYHVKEYYEGDNIKFDYKIRRGMCTSTNAKYLMKKLEIID